MRGDLGLQLVLETLVCPRYCVADNPALREETWVNSESLREPCSMLGFEICCGSAAVTHNDDRSLRKAFKEGQAIYRRPDDLSVWVGARC